MANYDLRVLMLLSSHQFRQIICLFDVVVTAFFSWTKTQTQIIICLLEVIVITCYLKRSFFRMQISNDIRKSFHDVTGIEFSLQILPTERSNTWALARLFLCYTTSYIKEELVFSSISSYREKSSNHNNNKINCNCMWRNKTKINLLC